jgi:ribosomal protein L40E
MSRAHIRVEVNQSIAIGGITYRVAEHPALAGIPYVQRGGRGFVIQIIAPNADRMALKYFKLKYRVPDLVKVAEALRQFANLKGLRAAQRTVFTQRTHADLIAQYPALDYGMLMPWLPGVTWYDVINTRMALSATEGVRLARNLAEIMASLEARNAAHCDIAGANVLVERKSGQVELVDIEEMYAPNMPAPVEMPIGQDGYQHAASRQNGQWCAEGDRFGAAILIAEMLGWTHPKVRQFSADEHYFAGAEMQDVSSTRYKLLHEVLAERFSPRLAELLRAAWHSRSLAECPPLAEWRRALDELPDQVGAQPEAKLSQAATPSESAPSLSGETGGVISGRRAIAVQMPSENAAAQAPRSVEQLRLDGVRLCRNCGALNNANEQFCKRCGFYIGTGARRPPPKPAPSQPPASAFSMSKPVPPPQPVALNRNLSEIVSGRRVGDPKGGGMIRVEPAKPKSEQVEANAGSIIVIGALIGLAILLVLLILTAG